MKSFRLALALLASLGAVEASATPKGTLETRVLALIDDYRAEEARELLKRSTPADPRLLGLVHHALYRPDSTLAVLGPLHRAGSADSRVVFALAEAFLWKKDYRNAQALLDAWPGKDDLGYLRVLATQMELVNRHGEALAIWDEVIGRDPRPWGAMERKAIVLSWTKRFDESQALFAKVASSNAASAPLRLRCQVRRAEVMAWSKDLEGALKELRGVLASHPDHVEASLLRGQILEWLGRYPEAKATYTAVLQKRPDLASARLRLEKLGWVK
jgi:tetratricopeptide (TPR) repeat protein